MAEIALIRKYCTVMSPQMLSVPPPSHRENARLGGRGLMARMDGCIMASRVSYQGQDNQYAALCVRGHWGHTIKEN